MFIRASSLTFVILAGFITVETLSWSSPFSSTTCRPSETVMKMSDCNNEDNSRMMNRRKLLQTTTAAIAAWGSGSLFSNAADLPDSLDVSDFLKTGMVQQPMGVSGQAGKSRPETGVVLREGSEVARDSRSGNVLAEILVGSDADPTAVVASYQSPWPLASGTVFDVECRDAKTGDGAFLAVTSSTKGKALSEIPASFFLDQLMKPTGRFSFYGVPTDVKVKKDTIEKDYRFVELTFSNLSQSTMTEIPRKAIIATTIVPGTDNAVMLVGSATSSRWKKGSGDAVKQTVESFRATAAPKSNMKIRAKQRREDV